MLDVDLRKNSKSVTELQGIVGNVNSQLHRFHMGYTCNRDPLNRLTSQGVTRWVTYLAFERGIRTERLVESSFLLPSIRITMAEARGTKNYESVSMLLARKDPRVRHHTQSRLEGKSIYEHSNT